MAQRRYVRFPQGALAQPYDQLEIIPLYMYERPCAVLFVHMYQQELQLRHSLHSGQVINAEAHPLWSCMHHFQWKVFVEAQ